MIQFVEKIPMEWEYNALTEQVGWGTEPEHVVRTALENTIYSVCAYDGGRIVGYARLIGDRVLFAYIQDVMVVPDYQGQQIGSRLIEHVLEEVKRLKSVSPNLRTYLGASKGKEGFYEKFGFVSRKDADLGEGMILL
ncbi:MAG: GNAT family N-acetyltransferase [Hominenteromicrobium sp.]